MKSLSPKVIDYFILNEAQIAQGIENNSKRYNSGDWGSVGYLMFKYSTPDGDVLQFSPIDFMVWQKNKEMYNSPLYRALHE